MVDDDVKKLHRYFKKAHVDDVGRIDLKVFATQNSFSSEVLSLVTRLFDTEYVNFEEFLLMVYDLITTKSGDLPLLIFHMFDVDKSGTLTEEEALRMLTTLNSEHLTPMPIILNALKKRPWGEPISTKTFKALCDQFPRLMLPILSMQQAMIQQSIGIVRAKAVKEMRETRFENLPLVQILKSLVVRPACFSKLMVRTKKHASMIDKLRMNNAIADPSAKDVHRQGAIRRRSITSESVATTASIQNNSEVDAQEYERPSNKKICTAQRALSSDAALRQRNKEKDPRMVSSGKADGSGASGGRTAAAAEGALPPPRREEIKVKPKPSNQSRRHRRTTH